MRKRALVGLALLWVTVALAPVSASADGLLGDSVTLTIFFPDVLTVQFNDTATVAPGLEFVFQGAVGVDLDVNTIDVGFGGDFDIPGPLLALLLTDLNFPGGITGLSLATNVPGMDASRLEFTGDAVAVHLEGLIVTGQSQISITLLTTPLPSGLVLLATGLLTAAAFSRRRR